MNYVHNQGPTVFKSFLDLKKKKKSWVLFVDFTVKFVYTHTHRIRLSL